MPPGTFRKGGWGEGALKYFPMTCNLVFGDGSCFVGLQIAVVSSIYCDIVVRGIVQVGMKGLSLD